MFRRLSLSVMAIAGVSIAPGSALAWGYEGHEIIADIARSYLEPEVRARVHAILSQETDPLTARCKFHVPTAPV